ncbi:MAG: outer membrane protein [Legionellales bacterium]
MNIKLLSAALLTSSMTFAAAPVDGWYTSVFGGYTYLPNNINTTYLGQAISNTSANDGYNAGARLGFQSNPIRYELEYTYLEAETQNFYVNNLLQTGITGSTVGNLLMANIYYDCPEILPAIAPYLGVGIGYAFLKTTLNSTGPIIPTYFSAKENPFAYQATAGLTYNFSENYAANIAYRYMATSHGNHFGSTFQAQMANAGVIYHFDKGTYK